MALARCLLVWKIFLVLPSLFSFQNPVFFWLLSLVSSVGFRSLFNLVFSSGFRSFVLILVVLHGLSFFLLYRVSGPLQNLFLP